MILLAIFGKMWHIKNVSRISVPRKGTLHHMESWQNTGQCHLARRSRKRSICNNVFKCIWSCFYFENTKLNDTKVLTIKKRLKMRSILRWIHVMIYLSLLFHDFCLLICKKACNRDIELIFVIRKFIYKGWEHTFAGGRRFYPENIV